MAVSPALSARRALVKLLLTLASLYSVAVDLNRDSCDKTVATAFKKVFLKAHPDKGGTDQHAQQLNSAKAAWDKAKAEQPKGRPATSGSAQRPKAGKRAPSWEAALGSEVVNKSFRINSIGVLLTYFGVQGHAQWKRFLDHVASQQRAWGVTYWCATLERTKTGRLHIHLMLQFLSVVDKSSAHFWFEDLKCRADQNDLLGVAFCRKKVQDSLNRGMFYCWADKRGTERDESGHPCTAGNYEPAWTEALCTYAVRSRWAEDLWKAYKLTNEVYEEYLYKSRDGVLPKKRNLDACVEREEKNATKAAIEERTKRIRSNPALFQSFPPVPEATAWLENFKVDKLRYPLLVVLGKSHTGKTEWAQSLFKNPLKLLIGSLEHFPEAMRSFKRAEHDGLVLDDLRDLRFLVAHQDKLQGKYNSAVEFASTPGGGLAYWKDLFAVPVVATLNYSTKNLGLLETDDYLAKPENRTLLHYPPGAASASR